MTTKSKDPRFVECCSVCSSFRNFRDNPESGLCSLRGLEVSEGDHCIDFQADKRFLDALDARIGSA